VGPFGVAHAIPTVLTGMLALGLASGAGGLDTPDLSSASVRARPPGFMRTADGCVDTGGEASAVAAGHLSASSLEYYLKR
jgi:hypothetical protein